MSRRINVGEQYGYDLTHALAEVPLWHTLYLPSEVRRYVPGGPKGWRLSTQGTTLEGDGRWSGGDAGLWPWAHPDVPELRGTGDSNVLCIGASNLTLRELVIDNDRGYVKGTGDHISFLEPFTIGGLRLEGVSALYAGRHCLNIQPVWNADGNANYCVSPEIISSTFYGSGSDGIVLDTITDMVMDRCMSTRHQGRGLILTRSSGSKIRCGCESVNGGMLLKDCNGIKISGWFEQFARFGWDEEEHPTPDLNEPAIILDNCRGVTIEAGCVFEHWDEGLGRPKPTSILLRNGTTGCTIETNMHVGVRYSIDDGGCSGNIIHRQTSPKDWPTIPWKVSSKRNEVIG